MWFWRGRWAIRDATDWSKDRTSPCNRAYALTLSGRTRYHFCWRTKNGPERALARQECKGGYNYGLQLAQRLLLMAPSFTSSAIVSGYGEMRDTGPFAMSAVV